MLDAFLAGFSGSLYDDEVKKEEEARANRERMKAFNLRMKEANQLRLWEEQDKAEDRKYERSNAREGAGYNPATGKYEWVDGNGQARSRNATAAEKAEYEARQAQAKQEGLLAQLDADAKRAQIAQRNASTRYNNERSRGGREDTPIRPTSLSDAYSVVTGKVLSDVDPNGELESLNSIDKEIVRALHSGQLERRDVEAYRKELIKKQDKVPTAMERGTDR